MPGACWEARGESREQRAKEEEGGGKEEGGKRKRGRRRAGEKEEVSDQVSIQNEYLNHRRVGNK